MTTRAKKKQQSLERILDVASAKFREEGLTGAAIAPVMKEAGLTHGAFYSHFDNKDELARAAFRHALDQSQPDWLGTGQESWPARLKRLATSYLKPAHRDDRAHGCAISALVSQAAGASAEFRRTFGESVEETLQKVCDADDVSPERRDEAIAFLVLCVGGINLARAVDDPRLSDRILEACRRGVEKISA